MFGTLCYYQNLVSSEFSPLNDQQPSQPYVQDILSVSFKDGRSAGESDPDYNGRVPGRVETALGCYALSIEFSTGLPHTTYHEGTAQQEISDANGQPHSLGNPFRCSLFLYEPSPFSSQGSSTTLGQFRRL